MGWPTKTNCDTPRPTLGNPASLLPYVYNPRPLTEQERHAFCNPPAPDPRPAAARPYTDVVTLTDADDLADFFPSTPPAPAETADDPSYGQLMSCPPPPCDLPHEINALTAPAETSHDLVLPTIPRVSPAGTSLTEPDNLRRVH